jgi:hypothetical protein
MAAGGLLMGQNIFEIGWLIMVKKLLNKLSGNSLYNMVQNNRCKNINNKILWNKQ